MLQYNLKKFGIKSFIHVWQFSLKKLLWFQVKCFCSLDLGKPPGLDFLDKSSGDESENLESDDDPEQDPENSEEEPENPDEEVVESLTKVDLGCDDTETANQGRFS